MGHTSLSWHFTLICIRRDTLRYSGQHSNLWKQAIKNLYSHPTYAAVLFYRFGRWTWANDKNWLYRVLYFFYRLIYPLVRWYSGVELQARTDIGPGLCIMHFGPVVIHPDTIAGEDMTIMSGVTIGEGKNGTPRLGDRVAIGTGAIVIGRVTVGDDVNIGAGAVVTQDLPGGCTAVGVPAKPIRC